MLARNPISDAIMIDVDYLHFGKLINSADGLSAAPEGLGVTSRSRGLKAEHDGELRLNTLLEVPVFSPAMIDARMADKGLLLVRTLPGTAAAPKGRTVFVRARFRQENSQSSDSRPHQQASIWVVNAEKWYQHPAAILAKVGSELEAEPDRADARQRFGAPPKEVELDGACETGEPANEKWRYAYFSMLDMLLQRVGDSRAHDREVTFGCDIFDSEPEFLATAGQALRDLPLDFERWKDIRIGSGLRSSGGLTIRYLPSEENTMRDDISPRIISIRNRRQALWGAQPSRPARTLAAILAPASAARAATNGRAAAAGATPSSPGQPAARPTAPASGQAPTAAATPRGTSSLSPQDAAQDFRDSLRVYRDARNGSTAQKLVEAAAQGGSAARNCLSAEHALVYDAVCSATQEPPRSLPLGMLYDRVVLVSYLPSAPYAEQWFKELSSAIARTGVLLPLEVDRMQPRLCGKFGRDEALRKTWKNSQELKTWLGQVKTDPGALVAMPDLSFLQKLHERLKGKSLAQALAHTDHGVNNEVLARGHFLLNSKELVDTHDELLHCMATHLYNTLNQQNLAAETNLA